MAAEQVEEMICLISSMERSVLMRQLLDFDGRFPVDFTPEYLAGQSTEQLQHILFALCVQQRAA